MIGDGTGKKYNFATITAKFVINLKNMGRFYLFMPVEVKLTQKCKRH